MRVLGQAEPRPVEIYEEHGRAWARLARNAVRGWSDGQDGAEPSAFWEWDEITFPTDLTEAEVLADFDALWYAAERREMDDDEWRSDIESALLDLMEVMVG